MCTASWTVRDRGYRLLFNRDEQRSRPRADVPRAAVMNGLEVIAPIDGPGGGSWIAVNQNGVTAFLLNNYAAGVVESKDGAYHSRGALPLEAVSQPSCEDAIGKLRCQDLSLYRPFFLGLLEPSANARVFAWDGRRLNEQSPDLPFLTTSSFRSSEVERYRRERYLEMGGGALDDWEPDRSFEFHTDRDHHDAAFNPFMSREDAETHCVSVVEVGPEKVQFAYYDRPLGGTGLKPDHVVATSRSGGVA